MTNDAVIRKANQVHKLDAATQGMIESVKRKNAASLRWFIISWSILLVVGIGGIYRQNQIAIQNKQHIDCIIKLLATPQKPGTQHKFISDLGSQCNIKFTP